MSFDGNGTFNPLITFVPNTLATAEDQNAQDLDFANGLSNCITRDGQSPATSSISMGGNQINNVAAGTAPTDAINLSQLISMTYPGVISIYGGSVAPTGFLICDGTAYSRSTYSALFAVIGTTYGVGDGSSTFNVPDLRGRTPVGSGSGPGLTSRTIGTLGGEETHVLSVAELAAHSHVDSGHTHTTTDPGHTHSFIGPLNGPGGLSLPGGGNFTVSTTVTTGVAFTGVSVNPSSANLQNTGSGSGHNNMQPWLAINYIIKT